MSELDYVYEVEQVTALMNRALDIYFDIAKTRSLPNDLQVPILNATINMVATVKQVQLVPQGMVLPPRPQG